MATNKKVVDKNRGERFVFTDEDEVVFKPPGDLKTRKKPLLPKKRKVHRKAQ